MQKKHNLNNYLKKISLQIKSPKVKIKKIKLIFRKYCRKKKQLRSRTRQTAQKSQGIT